MRIKSKSMYIYIYFNKCIYVYMQLYDICIYIYIHITYSINDHQINKSNTKPGVCRLVFNIVVFGGKDYTF